MVTDLSGHVPRTVPARFEVIDDRFAGVGGDAHMEVLFSAGRWLEGPAYVPAGRYVLFSDIPNDRVLRWDETTGAVGVFAQPAGYANGRTLDRRAAWCRATTGTAGHPHRTRRQRHRPGSHHRGPPAQQPQRRRRAGRRLDLVHRSQLRHRQRLRGPSGRQRDRRLPRLPHRRRSGDVHIVADDFERPNGLAFSATSASSTSSTPARRPHPPLRRRRRRLARPAARCFADCDAGSFDGLRLDDAGRLWARGARRAALLRPRRHAARQAPRARDRAPTSPSAARSATTCSSPQRPASTPSG